MKEIFNKKGVTLLELLIVITLTSLIFALGIYPLLTQMKLNKTKAAEIALFDDANLMLSYISTDAMMATAVTEGLNFVEFEIDRGAETIRYDLVAPGAIERNGVIITRRLNFNPLAPLSNVFTITPYNFLKATLFFVDPEDDSITTRRDFEVMLRCRDIGEL